MREFEDRASAGRILAAQLASMDFPRPVVLALPRGGVPVGYEIAKALKAPLDLVLVRKIGLPSQPELAAAAIVDGEPADIVLNEEVISWSGLSEDDVDMLARRELAEIERRRNLYLAGRIPVSIAGRTAIVVDDGIATGTTVRAVLRALGRRGAIRIVLAVPVLPADELVALRSLVDFVVYLHAPETFFGIGQFYRDFHQLSDREVINLLNASAALHVRDEAEHAPEPSRTGDEQ